jgi:hypothetical protein
MQMANRIVLYMSMALAGVALAAMSVGTAPAADECIARPKGVAPAGKHWYYRTNRTIQRKCWYLANEGEATTVVTPRKKSVSATPVDPGPEVSTQPVADARAELVDGPRDEQPAAAVAPQPEATQVAPDSSTVRSWAVASRWPDASDALGSGRATTVSDPAPVSQIASPPPVPAAMPVPQPSAPVESTDEISLPLIAAAILLVIMGGVMIMFLSSRRLKGRNSFSQHRVAHRNDQPRIHPGAAPFRQPGMAIRVPDKDRLRDEIEELLEIGRTAPRS